MVKTQFTPEEEAILTPFDAAAADSMRVNARKDGSIPPAWLCCSEEARSEARNNVLVTLRLATGSLGMTLEEAARYVASVLPRSAVEPWRNMELALKQARSEGNPRAFFVG